MRSQLATLVAATVVAGGVVTGLTSSPAAAAAHRPGPIKISSTRVAENAAHGTLVGRLSASDRDRNYHHTFALVKGAGSRDNGLFAVRGNRLVVTGKLDHETAPKLSVRIRVTDKTGLQRVRRIALAVRDVNEAPTDIVLSPATVPENAAGARVGTLTATDPDRGDRHTFRLVSGAGDTDNALFSISGATLRTAAALDYETRTTYSVRVRATDAVGKAHEKALTVTVTDVDDAVPPHVNRAPIDLRPTNVSIDENQDAGTLVATATATDPDGDALTYSLVGGSCAPPVRSSVRTTACLVPSSSFAVAADGRITTRWSLDYEGGPSSYVITVRATDPDGLFTEADVTIDVNDVNDAPTGVSLGVTSEEADAGYQAIGTLTAIDQDADDTHTFTYVKATDSLSEDASAYFTVAGADHDQLWVRSGICTGAPSDTYRVTVRVTDGDGLTFDQKFPITIDQSNPLGRC